MLPTARLRAAFEDRRILLTGHTGFKGAWLTLLLSELGAHVHGISLDPEPGALFTRAGLANRCASDARLDIRDPTAVQAAVAAAAPDVVLHLAAESLVRRGYRQPVQTFATNVMGTAHVLEAVRQIAFDGPVVVVTTDKVYANDGRKGGYTADDRLGGTAPYSASKAASELVAATWRTSFHIQVATARAGNVIGGGDVCEARLLPDTVRAWQQGRAVPIRSPRATRPWQHVLEPLLGYLELAAAMQADGPDGLLRGWNFGPTEAAWPVRDVLDEAVRHWPGAAWHSQAEPDAPKEAARLDLDVSETLDALPWRPRWDTREAIARTIGWERAVFDGQDPLEACMHDLRDRLDAS